jgi:hypothetical protein
VRTQLPKRLAILALALAPGAAAAITGSARAGVLYSRFDARPHDGGSSTVPRLDLDLGLDLKGVIVSRDVASYTLAAAWDRRSEDIPGGSRTSGLSYSGSASFLQNRVSPVELSVFASRGHTDFATNAAPDAFGSGLSMNAGGGLTLKGPLPLLDVSYSWSDSETHVAGQPLRAATAHLVTSSLQLGSPTASVTGTYSGEFRDGSWASDRVQLHGVTLNATGRAGKQVVSLTGGSSMTLPGELVPGTYRQQTTSFGAGVNFHHDAGLRRMVHYQWGDTLIESPGSPTQELERQTLRYEGDHLLTQEHLFTRWIVDTSYAATRSDDTELLTTGETLGGALYWRPKLQTYKFELNAGPRVSLIQQDGDQSGGFGAAAGVRASRPLGVHSVRLDWRGAYGQNLFATAGWQLSQGLGAELSGPASTARYTAVLQATAFRTHNPVTGDGAGRSVVASASLRTSRMTLHGRARLAEGIVGSTVDQFTSDGLLLPAPFNSTQIDASLGVGAKLFSGLSAKVDAHVGRSDIPNRPLLHEVAGVAGLTYRYAGLAMAIEDRVSRVETQGGGWDTTNTVMFRVYRTLSW